MEKNKCNQQPKGVECLGKYNYISVRPEVKIRKTVILFSRSTLSGLYPQISLLPWEKPVVIHIPPLRG
jgi:hypothetical protein